MKKLILALIIVASPLVLAADRPPSPQRVPVAGSVSVDVPQAVPEHQLVIIQIAGSVDAKNVNIDILSVRDGLVHFSQAVPLASAGQWAFVDRPGRYSISVSTWTAEDGFRKATANVEIVGANPQPKPDPPTTTEPDPVELPEKRMAVIVYESAEGSIPLHVHAAAKELSEQKKIQVRIVDKDTQTGDGATPDEIAVAVREAGRLPALVICSADGGTFFKRFDLPGTAESIVEAVTGGD